MTAAGPACYRWAVMRKGVIVSVGVHCGLMLGVLLALASPKPFDSRPEEAIVVDVVTPSEVPEAKTAPEKTEPKKPEPKKPEPKPEPQLPGAAGNSAGSPPASAAPQSQQAAAPAPEPQGSFSTYDPAGMLAMYNMRLPGAGFDAPAEQTAKLSGDDVGKFRAHLKKCWRLPAGLPASSGTRVVIRVSLSPSGALAAEPALVEASAAEDGPAVMQTAMRALEACQPYGFLPRERYSEWKVLDIGFSPREMAGS
jgi:hypothetical protein